MIRLFCDRCGLDVTDVAHGAIHGIKEVTDADGSGNYTDSHDVICTGCYGAFRTFMTVLHEWDKRAKRLRAKQERASAKADQPRRPRRRTAGPKVAPVAPGARHNRSRGK